MFTEPIKIKNFHAPLYKTAEEFLNDLVTGKLEPVLEFLNGEITTKVDERDVDTSFLTSEIRLPPESRREVLNCFRQVASFVWWKPIGKGRESLSLVIRIEHRMLQEAITFLKQTVDAHRDLNAFSRHTMFKS